MNQNNLHSLCSPCSKIDFNPPDPEERRQYNKLYKNILDVEESSRNGCHLCNLLFSALTLNSGGTNQWRRFPDGPVKVLYKESLPRRELHVTCNDFGQASLPVFGKLSTIGRSIEARNSTIDDRFEVTSSQLSSDSGSPEIFSQITKWIQTCDLEHHDCKPFDGSLLPTRVIDVGSHDNPPRLFITNTIKAEYIALSYRWGTSDTVITTTTNLSDRIAGIELVSLPKTLHDAMIATRQLGIRYIWIDALCILQDSEADWVREASQMPSIYQNAYLTISADSAEDSDAGFLGIRDLRAIRACEHPAGVIIHPAVPPVFEIVDKGGLSQRCWVLQERIFSRRMVHWDHLEVGWECQEMQATERDVVGNRGVKWKGFPLRKALVNNQNRSIEGSEVSQSLDVNASGKIYDMWYSLVEEYSERLLTYPDKDKLIALGGIASAFHEKYKDITGPPEGYLSGLWKGDLARGLAYTMSSGKWFRVFNGLPEIPKCSLNDSTTWTYRSPSFSWTSFDDTVKWDRGEVGDEMRHEYDVQVIRTDCVVKKGPWGAVQSCRIVLKGVVLKLQDIGKVSRMTCPDPDQPYGKFPLETRLVRLSVKQLKRGSMEQTWLMLYPLDSGSDQFRRLGTMITHGDFSMDLNVLTEIEIV